jgi:hypothetical protein
MRVPSQPVQVGSVSSIVALGYGLMHIKLWHINALASVPRTKQTFISTLLKTKAVASVYIIMHVPSQPVG